ncbi:hypothetical protein TCAL_06008 [Tigriopus californicus]|uniref:F-box domain-containing protein n=1 Tax=Tigriopus californicus TaxID=6832 RepID=A0A553PQI6_TIGCA|nr:uncharacterized protein LOC131881625 [Tigriopus californicus]TRY79942.1 hypothetical protein TCAL_06008 [Tigriopus californicus]
MPEVTFSPFEQLFDRGLTKALVNIFVRLDPCDYDACVQVCHSWRAFIAKHLVCHPKRKWDLIHRKLPYEWLHTPPVCYQSAIAKTLAPPLRIYMDRKEILLTTIDSILVWNRKSKVFRGEFGPQIRGANHVMIRGIGMDPQIIVTIHSHTSYLVVWDRVNYRMLQEVQCIGNEGIESQAQWIHVVDKGVLVWLLDGSIIIFAIQKDGHLRRRASMNGHIQGNCDAAVDGNYLLTASADSKVNLWNWSQAKLCWSNSRSQARYKKSRLSDTRAVVAGSYDEDGYLQIYDRLTGDLMHEMVLLESRGVQDIFATRDKIIALLSIRHKLLRSKVLVLDANTGDHVAEQTFVDVIAMNIVCQRVLVCLNNQAGDFRSRISIFDTDLASGMFNVERVVYQYAHSYWKLPIRIDDSSIVHTSEEKSDLFIRDFDTFFTQFDSRSLTQVERRRINDSSFCFRLRQILFKKLCSKCTIM